MRLVKDHRIKAGPQHCPQCHEELNAHAGMNHEKAPKPGESVGICVYCGCIFEVTSVDGAIAALSFDRLSEAWANSVELRQVHAVIMEQINQRKMEESGGERV